METDVKWWELNTDISPNVSLSPGHDGVLTSHPHQGVGKMSLRWAGGKFDLESLSQKLKASHNSENQNLINEVICIRNIQELLSEQLTLQITTEPSDCKNWRGWSHLPTQKPRTWKGLVTEEVSVKAGGGPTIRDYFRKYLSCLPPCFPVTWRTNPNSLTGAFPFTSASPPQLCQGRDLPILLKVSLCSLCP